MKRFYVSYHLSFIIHWRQIINNTFLLLSQVRNTRDKLFHAFNWLIIVKALFGRLKWEELAESEILQQIQFIYAPKQLWFVVLASADFQFLIYVVLLWFQEKLFSSKMTA